MGEKEEVLTSILKSLEKLCQAIHGSIRAETGTGEDVTDTLCLICAQVAAELLRELKDVMFTPAQKEEIGLATDRIRKLYGSHVIVYDLAEELGDIAESPNTAPEA